MIIGRRRYAFFVLVAALCFASSTSLVQADFDIPIPTGTESMTQTETPDEEKTETAQTCSGKSGGSTTTEAKSVDAALKQTDKTSDDVVTVSAEGKVSITSKCNPKCIGDKLKDAKGNASSTPCPAGKVTMELPNGVKVTCSKEKEACGKAVEAAATSKEVLDALKKGDVDAAGKLFAEKIASDKGFQSAISSAEQSVLNSAFTDNLPDEFKAAGKTLQQSTADMLRAIGDGNFSEIKNIAEKVQKDPAIQAFLKDPQNIARLAGQYLPQEAKQAVSGMTDAVCALAGEKNCAQLRQVTSSLTGGGNSGGSGNSNAPFVQYDRKYGLPDGTLAKIAKIEAGCGVKSSLSSATGCFQWINSSWTSVTKELYGQALPLSARNDPNVSADVTAAYLSKMRNKYGSLIAQAGLDTPVALYMIHNLGEGSGTKFLRAYAANPNMSVGNVLSGAEIRNNKSLYTVRASGGTYLTSLSGAVSNISNKMGSGIGSVPIGSPFSVTGGTVQASFSNLLSGGSYGGGTSYSSSQYTGGGTSYSSSQYAGGGTQQSSFTGWLSNLFSGGGAGQQSGNSGAANTQSGGTSQGSVSGSSSGSMQGPTTGSTHTTTGTTAPIELPSISFTASPNMAQKGDSFLLIWAATGVSSTAPCLLKNDQGATLTQSNAGSYVAQVPVSTSISALSFTLSCTPHDLRAPRESALKSAMILIQ